MNEKKLKVLQPGVEVEFNDGVLAIIIAVMIEDRESVSYKVAWWNGRTRNEQWVRPFEIKLKPSGTPTLTIGFDHG